MRFFSSFFLLSLSLLALLSPFPSSIPPVLSSNKGVECALCTVFVGLIEQQATLSSSSITTAINTMCGAVSSNKIIDLVCSVALSLHLTQIEADYAKGISPDQTCQTVGSCTDFGTCSLWESWPTSPHPYPNVMSSSPSSSYPTPYPSHLADYSLPSMSSPQLDNEISSSEWMENIHPKIVDDMGLDSLGMWLGPLVKGMAGNFLGGKGKGMGDKEKNHFNDINGKLKGKGHQIHHAATLPSSSSVSPLGDIGNHHPLFDSDNDNFSPFAQLRGSDWRGKDCDDKDNTVYPGRRVSTDHPVDVDYNCNGIVGSDNNGVSYEEMFCGATRQFGIISIGDSATAHFHIPPPLLTMPWNSSFFPTLLPALTDELDYPQCSWSTAHTNASDCPFMYGNGRFPLTSLYQLQRTRNLCMHRDYQNLGVNGARSTNTQPPKGDIMAIARNGQLDQPAVVFFSLIGNDVCNGHHTFDTMTPYNVFLSAVWASLAYLDTTLPQNSVVLMSGLVDGRVLYDTVSSRIHPIGENYTTFYNYLNCIEVSPCWGWMNSNETVRDLTTAHAMLLNTAYQVIEKQQNFTNIIVKYFYPDVVKLMKQWVDLGGEDWQLIEPVDGFHPDTNLNSLLAQDVFEFLEANFTEAVVPMNENNQNIIDIFGANLNGY